MKKLFWLAAFAGAGVVLLRSRGYDLTVGGLVLGPSDVERLRLSGTGRSRVVIGGCVIGRDVDAETLVQAIPSLVVVGGCVGPEAVATVYGSRLKVMGGAVFRENHDRETGDSTVS